MASIDQKVVSMTFDNSKFQGAVSATLGILKKLEESLKLDNASKGLDGITKAANQVDIDGLSNKTGVLNTAFGALKVAGVGALLAIGAQAVQTGQQLMSSMTQSVREGFAEYETKIGSIQTILANTRKHGTQLSDVTKNLSELNDYADKTIYSFGDMTRNIGLFTNAGLKLEESTSMIKGFSNEAAASGTTAAGAAGAAYQLSQALSAGTIRLMDWRSLTNVGMGNDNMKKGLIDIATAMNTVDKATATKAMTDFNGSLEKGWLTADVMSKYLQIVAGDMDAAAMASLGLSQAQIENFQTHAQVAEDAATKVRTFSQLTGTLMEAMGSGWAQTFELIFGDFDQATELFSGIEKAIGGAIGATTDARNEAVGYWATWGGRDAVIQGVATAFESLSSILKVIGDSVDQVFPVNFGAELLKLSFGFRDLTTSLKPSEAQLKTFGTVLVAVLTVLRTGLSAATSVVQTAGRIFMAVLGVLGSLVSAAFERATAAINSFLSGFGAVDVDISFDGLTAGIEYVIKLLANAKKAIDDWRGASKSLGDAAGGFDVMKAAGEGFRKTLSLLSAAMNDAVKFAGEVKTVVGGALDFVKAQFDSLMSGVNVGGIVGWFTGLTDGIENMFSGFDMGALSSIVGSGAIVMVVKYIRDMFKSIGELKGGVQDFLEIGGAIKEAFGSLGGALDAAKTSLKADAVKSIAASLLILVAAMWVLSRVDGNNLGVAAAGMAVALTTLATTLLMIAKLPMNPVKILAVGAALVVLSGAIMTLGLAMLIFGNMSWEQLVKGLTALALTLAMLVISVAAFSAFQGKLITTAIGLQIIAGAILLLTGAVAALGAMPLGMLIQGGVAIGILMAALVLFVALVPQGQLMGTAAGMLLMSVAIGGLVASVAALSVIPMEGLIQGLVGLAATMGLLVVAARLAQGSIGGAAAMVLMAGAIAMLVPPLAMLGMLPVEALIQGLAGIAVALGLLVAAAALMQGALAGAAAMLIMAVSLTVLSVAILALGMAGPMVVLTGLLALAAGIAIFAAAAILLSPALPLMAAFAGVLLLFGAAIALAGVGILAFAVGLGMLGAAAIAGGMGLQILASAVVALAPHGLTIAAMGIAFAVLGVGLLAVGVGALAAGAGFLVLGVGLTLVAAAAIPGVIGLTALVDAVSGMIMQAPALGIMAAAFGALGAAMVLMGAGSLLLAAGALAVTLGIMALSAASIPAGMAIENLGRAFDSAASGGGADSFAASLAVAVAAVLPLAPAMLGAVGGVMALTGSLAAVSAVAAASSAALLMLGGAIATAAGAMTGSMAGMSAAATAGVSVISASLGNLGPLVGATAAQVAGASMLMAAAFTAMGAQSAAAVVGGSAQIIRALAPLPVSVAATAVAVTAASMLMVTAFRTMGSMSASAIIASGGVIRASLSGIAGSVGVAAVAVGTAVIQGMVRGLANSGVVVAAARRVALQALAAARNALGIASPSKEFEQIGEFANEGFARGLSGFTKAVNPVDEAFKDMEDRIADALTSVRDRIAKAQEDVNKYSKSPRKYKKELAEARRELADAKAAEAMANRASVSLQNYISREGAKLKRLRDDYDAMAEQIDKAEQAYEDAVRRRDDAIDQYRDSYGGMPSMTGSDDEAMTYDRYIQNMTELTEKTRNYRELLESLRAKGLNDKVYTKLLDSGLEALPFVEDLVLAGDNAILNMNKMADDLDDISGKLGNDVGRNMYQAGVDAAEGLLKGLKDRKERLATEIQDLVSVIVTQIKKDLQIQSPSKVMTRLGRFVTDGLVKGLSDGTSDISKSAHDLSSGFKKDLESEFSSVSNPFLDIFDGDLTIRPVMDLSQIEAGAAAIQAMLAAGSMSPDISVSAANGVSRSVRTGRELEMAAVSGGDTINYIQNNTSPKALNAGEIYRQTNNQISRLRKDL